MESRLGSHLGRCEGARGSERNTRGEVCDCVSVYLQDHSHRCVSRQSEAWGSGLREELWMRGAVVDKALTLGGRECPLELGRKVQEGVRECRQVDCVFVSLK